MSKLEVYWHDGLGCFKVGIYGDKGQKNHYAAEKGQFFHSFFGKFSYACRKNMQNKTESDHHYHRAIIFQKLLITVEGEIESYLLNHLACKVNT